MARRPPKTLNGSVSGAVKMTPAIRKALERQRQAFRAKFGRDPEPSDPLFFDCHADEPRPKVNISDDVLEALRKVSVSPEHIYAFTQTGRLNFGGEEANWSVKAVAEWDAKVAEFRGASQDVADVATSFVISIERAAAWLHSHDNPAFEGTIEFDLELNLLGEKAIRRARIEYDYTPSWEYYDLRLKRLFVGWEIRGVGLSILIMPEEEDEDDGPEEDSGDATDAEPAPIIRPESYGVDESPNPPAWLRSDLARYGVLTRRVWDRMDELIEEKCKAEDLERRRSAGL